MKKECRKAYKTPSALFLSYCKISNFIFLQNGYKHHSKFHSRAPSLSLHIYAKSVLSSWHPLKHDAGQLSGHYSVHKVVPKKYYGIPD